MSKLVALFAGLGAMAIVGTAAVSAQAGATFDAVKARGILHCGVNTALPGFSAPDEKGEWHGLDVDSCKAVAAAVFGDAKKVKYLPLNGKERFTALQSGEVDVLARNTTWTLVRDTSLGINFTGVNYYDGQGFLVKKSLNVKSAKELNGATICIEAGTTTELNLADYFRQHKMEYQPLVFDNADGTINGFSSGRCDVLTSDQSQLYALRSKLANPDEALVLPEVISKEPLGLSVRHGDDEWFDVVKWAHFVQINAEEMDITSKNVADVAAKTTNPEIRRFLGLEGDMGQKLGVAADFTQKIIAQVGNYSEMFERNVGKDSPLGIPRGLNALWSKGGIQYAPPVR